jgi:hypothetical protein
MVPVNQRVPASWGQEITGTGMGYQMVLQGYPMMNTNSCTCSYLALLPQHALWYLDALHGLITPWESMFPY